MLTEAELFVMAERMTVEVLGRVRPEDRRQVGSFGVDRGGCGAHAARACRLV